MDLTKSFSSKEYLRALAEWSWLDFYGKTPMFTSLFGDIFFEASDGWWFLDSIEGTLRREWDDHRHLAATLASEEGQDKYLLGALAIAAVHRREINLSPSQIYVFAPPPMFSGSFDIENIRALDFCVAHSIAAQLHGSPL